MSDSASCLAHKGCSLEQFCAAMPLEVCKDADWRNDEPKKPADCALAGKKPNRVCQPLPL